MHENLDSSHIQSVKFKKDYKKVLLRNSISNEEFQDLIFCNYKLNGDSKNCFVITKNKSILKIDKFRTIGTKVFVVGRAFLNKSDFYKFPIKSSFLDIYKCKKGAINITEISDLDRKIFAMEALKFCLFSNVKIFRKSIFIMMTKFLNTIFFY